MLKKSLVMKVSRQGQIVYEDVRAKIEFYIISLWLLFLLLIILTIDIPISLDSNSTFIGFSELAKRNIIPCIALGFLVYGMILCRKYKYKFKGTMQLPVKITNIQNINFEHLTFLTTYIIPLICFDFTKIQYFIVFTMLLIIIGCICVKTDLFYANPTLSLMGYYIYKVETNDVNMPNAIFISRDKLYKDCNVQYLQLDEKIFYVGSVRS